MNFYQKYFILLLTVFSGLFSAQTTHLKGFVFSSENGQTLSNAVINIIPQNQKTTSAKDGSFHIEMNGKTAQIQISKAGFKTQNINYSSENPELNIQLEPDMQLISEVVVHAFGSNKANKETAGAIAVLSGTQLRQGSGVSMQEGLNSVPGVRMDQSTLADSRISIRGNGVRASYGIRNIKIYLNDIPLTEADGTSRIEGLDVNDLGRAEIIKGPASSIYGGGTGGVINFKLERAPYQQQSISTSALTGSYGLNRWAATYRNGGERMNSYVSYGWQEYDGYREHSHDKRNFITGNFQIFPSEKQSITLILNRTTQRSQMPGALTWDQFMDNPRQAATINLDKNAGRNQTWTRIGMGQQYKFNDKLSNHSSVYTYFYDLDHPLPFAYIKNTYQSYGGRTRFDYTPGFSVLPTKFTAGAEFNQGFTKGNLYVNNHGETGNIIGNTDYKNTTFSFFYQSETQLAVHTTLALGISYNGITYNATDYLRPSQSGIKHFTPQASPRIALSHDFGRWLSLHGSVSTGFSPPTSTDILNEDRTINKNLQAEKAINYEIDAKGDFLNGRLAYDLSLFKMNVTGELIPQTVSQGVTIFHNSGKTTHNGAELALSYFPIKESDQNFISRLRPYLAVTYSDFSFKEYQILNPQGQVLFDYAGNKLTGVSPWVVNLGVNMDTQIGLYAFADYYFSDRLPLNDANTDFNPAYAVVNLKLGYRKRPAKFLEMDIYSGINNLTNTRYSSFTSLNAIGFGEQAPAYFNPSPARDWYGGLQLKFIF